MGLNLYLVTLRGDQVIDSTHLMMSVIMLIFINDKLSDKIKKIDFIIFLYYQ